jgi:DNA (cytosine-5)-methyltransferase 1
MKLGGLFSGIGGFELAWTQLGHEVAWMCEIDKNARKVLAERFPGVPIYEDVEQLDPAEVEAVDVLTGGSPCQGFSVAGSRSGLEHGESRLFADYIRIMNGLAERGLQWALWENVPGVLSIENDDGEKTYEHVVAALVGATEPVRLGQGRWNTGLADGGGRAVAWRVLDSRHFGVAQRRRRVFACVAFGGVAADRAGRALLAKSEGVSGDSAAGGQEGEGVAGGLADGAGIPSVARTLKARADGSWTADGLGNEIVPDAPNGFRMTAFGQYEDDDSASTLKQRDHKDATDLVVGAVAYGMIGASSQEGALLEEQPSLTASHGQPGNVAVPHVEAKMLFVRNGVEVDRHGKKAGKGALIATEEAPTLDAGNHWALFQPQAFDEMNFTTDSDTHHVLRAGTPQSTGVLQAQAFRKSARAQSVEDDESWVADGQANTLNTFDMGDTRTTHAIVEPVESLTPWPEMGEAMRVYGDAGASPSLKQHSPNVLQTYGVRRLTPVECERLQAFPDGWTEPAGSDSARYKALGNAVTVNTVRWVLGRMLEQS